MSEKEHSTPLLKECDAEGDGVEIVSPKCKLAIEPFMFISALFTMIMYGSYSQYIYKRVAESYNASTDISMNRNASATCQENKSDPSFILRQEIESAASYLNMEINIMYSCVAIVSSIWLNSLSDKRGRKYALAPALCGQVISYGTYSVVAILNLDIHYFFVGKFAEAFCGGWETIVVSSFAYIADISTPENRTFRIIFLEICFYVSAIFTSAANGYMIDYIGFEWMFVIAAAGKLVCVFYVIFILPETIHPLRKVSFFSLEHAKHSFRILLKNDSDPKKYIKLRYIFVAFFFSSTVYLATDSVDTLFQMNAPLCWDSIMIGK